MGSIRKGTIHLFRVAGIDLFLHWSWFIVAVFEIDSGGLGHYSSLTWSALEYLGLFVIVTLHEFGHALACRQVGGSSNQIVLWPLGGVAYVDPPPRPGAVLWSIVAGPLVNVVLMPVLYGLVLMSQALGWAVLMPNLNSLLHAIFWIDVGLLIFNILPIFPLDGGQIFQSLLWFAVGRARSLMIATIVGFIGIAGMFILAFFSRSVWFGVLAVFLLLNCWGGLQHARVLSQLAKLPRHLGFACPWCKTAPPIGNFWKCKLCGQPFDTFQTQAVCPNCSARFNVTQCLDCGRPHPMSEWILPSPVVPELKLSPAPTTPTHG
jgi:Zn-dependent protease